VTVSVSTAANMLEISFRVTGGVTRDAGYLSDCALETELVNSFYSLCYQTERNPQNWQSLKALEQATPALANSASALSHPGGRRFESG
jgi:hypothetical protein